MTDELKKIYTNHADNRAYWDAVSLYHPSFNVPHSTPYPSKTRYPSKTIYPTKVDTIAQSFFLIRDTVNHSLQASDGSTQTFRGYPFNIVQPEVGAEQQDIGIVLDNVSLEIISSIELASQNQSVPIEMTFYVFMEGSPSSQITPIVMALTEINVDMFTISCKASMTDLFKRKFPSGSKAYFDSKFVGLEI